MVYSTVPYNRPKPEVRVVYQPLKHISGEWYAIGRELEVDWNYREELKRDTGLTNNDRLEAVLHKWSQSECSSVTWDTIIEMLEGIDRRNVVRTVKDYLKAAAV